MPRRWPDTTNRCLAATLCVLALLVHLPGATAQTLEQRLHAALGGSKTFAGTDTSFTVLHWPSGKVIYTHAADQLLVPASNQKLLTVTAAVAVLGADYKLTTEVHRTGGVADGVLEGNLVVRGGGDPSLGYTEGDDKQRVSVLDGWAETIRRSGIRKVTGWLVVDDRIFDRQYVHPDWPEDQLSAWYCAQVAGLSFNDNCVDLTITPGSKAGDPVTVTMVPETDYIQLSNSARTSSSRPKGSKRLLIHRRDGTNRIGVSRYISRRTGPVEHHCTIDTPPLFLGQVFLEALRRKGVVVEKGVRLARNDEGLYLPGRREAGLLVEHKTPLAEVARRTLVSSQNLYAECLLKLIHTREVPQGTFRGGALKVQSVVMKRLGLRRGQLRVSDGSGMSRKNLVSSRVLARLLLDMSQRKEGALLIDNLPVAGVNGTMKKRLDDSPAEGHVVAKTGYLHGVVSRSGLVITREKHVYVFSFLVNDIRGRTGPVQSALDDACEAIYLHGD